MFVKEDENEGSLQNKVLVRRVAGKVDKTTGRLSMRVRRYTTTFAAYS